MSLAARAVAAAAALLLCACGTGGSTTGVAAISPREGRSGLQLSGTVDGRQVAVNDGLPELVVGDCDPPDGRDTDVCAISRTIDGRLFVLSLENPEVLSPGSRLEIADAPCGSPERCDEVGEVALVDVQLGTDRRVRGVGGSLEVTAVEDFLRYAGSLRLRLPDGGVLTGQVDLVPRPD